MAVKSATLVETILAAVGIQPTAAATEPSSQVNGWLWGVGAFAAALILGLILFRKAK